MPRWRFIQRRPIWVTDTSGNTHVPGTATRFFQVVEADHAEHALSEVLDVYGNYDLYPEWLFWDEVP